MLVKVEKPNNPLLEEGFPYVPVKVKSYTFAS